LPVRILQKLMGGANKAPQQAYDLWAENYDRQPDNLMFKLDEQLFSGLIADLDLKG
jgi:hypothetical protein